MAPEPNRGGEPIGLVAFSLQMKGQRDQPELDAAIAALSGRRHDIPRPIVGAQLSGYTVDFYWPEDNLVVELDGFAAHGTKSRFESDRRRDRRLALDGKKTIRVTAGALTNDEEAIAAELTELTSRSRASSSSAGCAS